MSFPAAGHGIVFSAFSFWFCICWFPRGPMWRAAGNVRPISEEGSVNYCWQYQYQSLLLPAMAGKHKITWHVDGTERRSHGAEPRGPNDSAMGLHREDWTTQPWGGTEGTERLSHGSEPSGPNDSVMGPEVPKGAERCRPKGCRQSAEKVSKGA